MMRPDFQISYMPVGTIQLSALTYVIIGAREDNSWIFVRHKERKSWELPAGHIEKNEAAELAAERELFEETGTIEAKINSLFDYSVTAEGETKYGRLFFAEIIKRGPVPDSEIAEIHLSNVSPQPATYPDAHKSFMKVLEKHIRKNYFLP